MSATRQTITVTLPAGFQPGDVMIVKVHETDRGAFFRVLHRTNEFHFTVTYLRWYERALYGMRGVLRKIWPFR